MKISRRNALAMTAAFAAVAPRFASAQIALGTKTLTSLSDGGLRLPTNLIFGAAPQDEAAAFIAEQGFPDQLAPPCNVTLLQDGDRNILFDVGAGPEFQSSAGYLLDALADHGLGQEDITDVIFTHAHPDHIWGLVDDFDDLTFPNAAYMIGQTEWDYWTDPETVSTISPDRTTFAVGAARRLERIKDMVTFVADGQEILPGVAARESFGHTPGHMAFEIRDGSESVMVLGDCIGNDHAAFAHPDWRSGSDQDVDAGVATRLGLLDQLAQDQMRVVGYHLTGNGIGHVVRHDGAYKFIPEV